MENEGRLSDNMYLSGLEDMIICMAEAIAKSNNEDKVGLLIEIAATSYFKRR